MAGSHRASAAGPGELEVAHDEEASPNDEFEEDDDVVERAKRFKHGHGIVRKPMDGNVSRLGKETGRKPNEDSKPQDVPQWPVFGGLVEIVHVTKSTLNHIRARLF